MSRVRLTIILILISTTVGVTLPFSIASSQRALRRIIGKRAPAQKRTRARPSTVIASGEVLPNRFVKIRSELSGRIKKIFVEPGDEIAKRQALVVIEPQSNEGKITTQYSPVKGVVADIPTRIGETTAGGLTDAPLMIIADMSKIYVEVNVDGPDMSKVAAGQTAKIIVDAFSKSPIRGLVIRKDQRPVASSETPEFRVTIQMTQVRRAIRKRLRPGMSATAWIKIRT